MAKNRQYDQEYKVQSVKLAKGTGQAKAAKELGIPKNTLYSWMRANRLGTLDLLALVPIRRGPPSFLVDVSLSLLDILVCSP